MVHAERTSASLGQWLGLAILASGVVTGQLGAGHLLLAAWLENVSVGVATVVAILRAPGARIALPRAMSSSLPDAWRERTDVPGPPPAMPGTPGPAGMAPAPSPTVPPPGAAAADGAPTGVPVGCALPFFIGHFGIFTLVHGVFVAVLVAGATATGSASPLEDGWVALAVLVAAAIARSFRTLDPATAIGRAYGGVVPLHLAIFVGFFGFLGVGFLGAFGGVGGPVTGGPSRLADLAVTVVLLGLFAAADHFRARRD